METLSIIIPVVTAIISSAGGITGAYLAVRKGDHEQDVKNAQREQRQVDKIQELDLKIESIEKKVESHNAYAEKFAETSKSIAIIAKEIEFLKKPKSSKA